MNWSDEPFVKIYIRDTPEFLSLSWQARCLLHEIVRKVDRSGVLSVGKLGPTKGIAVAIRAPWQEIEAAVGELLESGRVVFDSTSGRIVVPCHIEAQEARQSDVARKRAERERRRAESQNVTPESQNVTDSHTPSRDVTHGHTPSLLDQNGSDQTSEFARAREVKGDGEVPSMARLIVLGTPYGRAAQEHAASLAMATGLQVTLDTWGMFVAHCVERGLVLSESQLLGAWDKWLRRQVKIDRNERERARDGPSLVRGPKPVDPPPNFDDQKYATWQREAARPPKDLLDRMGGS
jgi:hypothetical protein